MKPTIALTFDDGLDCQLNNVVPELDRRGIRATFFVLAKDAKKWKNSGWTGWHEIGSHSISHKSAEFLDEKASRKEAKDSRHEVEKSVGWPCTSFSYPFTDPSDPLKSAVREAGYLQARGGWRLARPEKFCVPGDGLDLFNTPCFYANESTLLNMGKWADECLRRQAWLTLLFHGVGEAGQWDNLRMDQFKALLDLFQGKGIEFSTYCDAAEEYRKG